jgi:hypothetical protein
MTSIRRPRAAATLAAGILLASGCARNSPPDLDALCDRGRAEANIRATVDHLRGPAGPALAALEGARFDVRLTFFAPTDSGAATSNGPTACTGTHGAATFSGEIPAAIRNATSAAGAATWRVEGDSVLLDLNPRVRDSNVFLTLPLDGGRGHWGLSTFAGEVAGGHTEPAP